MHAANIVESIIKPVTQGEVVATPLDKLTPADAVIAFKSLDFIEKQMGARKKELREYLLGYVEQHGTKDNKGSKTVVIEGSQVKKEKREASDPDADGLKGLLEKASLKISEAFDEVKVLQLNPSKLQFLVDSGKLDKKAVQELHAVTFALKLRESKALKELLSGAVAPKTSTTLTEEDE